MMDVIIASNNKGKIREIRELTKGFFDNVFSPADLGLELDIDETGKTFEENAIIKARHVYNIARMPALADDSGLCVDALIGEPGIRSARFAGYNATDEDNVKLLLDRLKGIPYEKRTARFICCMVLCLDGEKCLAAHGSVEGIILEAPRGNNGFGYDPVFYYSELSATFAELPAEVKNSISHR
ncbi:MAG TPA: RdgB/HAM1 family non-canonical purine NTP pyrophosphatase, partial [Clostridia bacterium]|nr:RdgB/HAM1 family non-canonical purine NTP pyrophosphatase [Clostridia bacterium]